MLIVTSTVDEGHAPVRVLTPGSDSRDDWAPYTKNFATISAQMGPLAPAIKAKRLGTYRTTEIGTKKVVSLKSDSHMSARWHAYPDAERDGMAADHRGLPTETSDHDRSRSGIGTAQEVGDVIDRRFLPSTVSNAPSRTVVPLPDGGTGGKLPHRQLLFTANAGY